MVGKKKGGINPAKADKIHLLKQQIAPLKKELEQLEADLKEEMIFNGIDSLEGKVAVATLGTREVKTVDGPAYWDLIDCDPDKLLPVVSFRLDPNEKEGKLGIRSFIGEEDLKSICSTDTVPVMTVKALIKNEPVPLSSKIVVPEPPAAVRRVIPGRRRALATT